MSDLTGDASYTDAIPGFDSFIMYFAAGMLVLNFIAIVCLAFIFVRVTPNSALNIILFLIVRVQLHRHLMCLYRPGHNLS